VRIESIKRWHWILIGALAGLAVAYGQFSFLGEKSVGLGVGKMTQIEFERELRSPPVEKLPILADITIHPRHEHDRVELNRLKFTRTGPAYQPAFYIADRPYVPRGQNIAPRPDYTVREFITGIAPSSGSKPVAQYAWWEARNARIAMGSIVGVLAIGGIWPFLLRMVVGGGLARKSKAQAREDFDLARFKSESAPPPSSVELSPEALAHLRELEEEMMLNLQSKTSDLPQPSHPLPQPQPVKQLGGNDKIKTVAGPQEDHEYKGEFYPVDRHKHDGHHAFSLVELLVVIGIIALLLAILLPALSIARQQAQTLKCAAQLKQLGEALHMYAESNKGSMPSWSAWQTYPDGGSVEDSPGLGWTELLAPHFVPPDSKIYNCPSFPGPIPMRNYFLAAKWAGKHGRKSTKFTEIRYSSYFVVSGDKTQMNLYPKPSGTADHVYDDCDPDDFGDDKSIMAWPWQAGGFWMHYGGNNALFADNTVRLFKRYDPASMTFSATEMCDWGEVSGN